jgi:hypothetical protein
MWFLLQRLIFGWIFNLPLLLGQEIMSMCVKSQSYISQLFVVNKANVKKISHKAVNL